MNTQSTTPTSQLEVDDNAHPSTERWVLGHRVQSIPTGADYALLSILTPPHTEGPPPHYHEDAAEVLHVVEGRLDVMVNGHWHALTSGQSVVAPVGVAHTFRNPTDHETRWVTSFAPAGFERFFHDFGVPVSQTGAREASTAPDLIERVLMECGRYGMIVVLPKAG